MIKLTSTESSRIYPEFIGQNWYAVREVRDPLSSTPIITERAFSSLCSAEGFFNERCAIAIADYKTGALPSEQTSFSIVDTNTHQELFQIALMPFEKMLETKMTEWIKKTLESKQPLSLPHVITFHIFTQDGFTSDYQKGVLFNHSSEEFIGWAKTTAKLDPERFFQLSVNQIKSSCSKMDRYELLYETEEPFGTISLVIRDAAICHAEDRANRFFSEKAFICK